MSTEVRKFDPLVKKITEWIGPMTQIEVKDKESKDLAYEALRVVKGYEQEVEKVRDAEVRPRNEIVKAINARAKQVLEPLMDLKSKLSKALIVYDANVRKEQEEAQRKLDAEKRQNERETRARMMNLAEAAVDLDPTTVAMQEAQVRAEAQHRQDEIQEKKDELKTETVKGLRSNWQFKITDPKAVKPEFLVPDEKTISKLVRSVGPKAVAMVGGIEVWDDPSIASGATPPPQRRIK